MPSKYEYQLSLLENYILKYRHFKEIRQRLKNDFGFLLHQVPNRILSIQNNVNESRSEMSHKSASVRSRRNSDNVALMNYEMNTLGSFGNVDIGKQSSAQKGTDK